MENNAAASRKIHRRLGHLARRRAALDLEIGRALVIAKRLEVHRRFGAASFEEYVHGLFGFDAHTVAERLRVAERLEDLPVTREALATGALSFSAVRELTRIAVPQTERAWVKAASGRTIREIEEDVAGARPGDQPDDARRPVVRKRRIRLEFEPEQFGLFRDAVARIREERGSLVSDEEAIVAMCRSVLSPAAADGAGAPPYQVLMVVCEQCGAGRQVSRGTKVDVGPVAVETAMCDAEFVSSRGMGKPTWRVSAKRRKAILARDERRCRIPGCRNCRDLRIHHIRGVSEGGTNDMENLITVCDGHHTAHHEGRLVIRGSASKPIIEHADGTPYGREPSPEKIDVFAKAFRKMRERGVREGVARASLNERRKKSHVGSKNGPAPGRTRAKPSRGRKARPPPSRGASGFCTRRRRRKPGGSEA